MSSGQAGKAAIGTYAIERMDRFRIILRKRDEVAVEAAGITAWFIGQMRSSVRK